MEIQSPPDVPLLTGFLQASPGQLRRLFDDLGLAMNFEDFRFCQEYFRDSERRNPTLTEIRVIDTYWSDHCRHTTFLTEISDVSFEPGRYSRPVQAAYRDYLAARDYVYGDSEKRTVSDGSSP